LYLILEKEENQFKCHLERKAWKKLIFIKHQTTHVSIIKICTITANVFYNNANKAIYVYTKNIFKKMMDYEIFFIMNDLILCLSL